MPTQRFDLNGKTALITGAAGLLGMEHTSALLECGANVVLTDISNSGLDKAICNLRSKFPTSNINSFKMDVSSYESIESIHRQLNQLSISINILINNAAIDPKVKSGEGIVSSSRLENISREEWDRQIEVGLTGALHCAQIFGSSMACKGKGGVIINIASDLSVIAPDQRLYKKKGLDENNQPVKPVTYSVIKFGLIGLTRYIATYWADKGVRCNALSPGGVLNNQGQDFLNKVSQLIPIERLAKPSEYRAAIQFLCSDASSYMNGHNLVIDGGRSIW